MIVDDNDRVWRPKEILRRYDAGERSFRDLQIEATEQADDPEFRGANLAGADFTGSFIFADFTRANLQNAAFAPANVKTCSFDKANLRNADFSGAAIDAATFEGADLTDANFERAGAYGYTYAKGECPGLEDRTTPGDKVPTSIGSTKL